MDVTEAEDRRSEGDKLAMSNVGEVRGWSEDWLQLICCAPTQVRSSISEVGARIERSDEVQGRSLS